MFIQTEQTPNPATLKFLPGVTVLNEGTADFRSQEDAALSPLAQRIFAVEGVQGVFLTTDFITITKSEEKEWYLLKPSLLGIIMEHFTAGRPVLVGTGSESEVTYDDEGADEEVVSQIRSCCHGRW